MSSPYYPDSTRWTDKDYLRYNKERLALLGKIERGGVSDKLMSEYVARKDELINKAKEFEDRQSYPKEHLATEFVPSPHGLLDNISRR